MVTNISHLQASRLDVLRGVETLRQLGQVDLDVVPTVSEFERQRADETTDFGRWRHAAGAKTSSYVPIIQHLQPLRNT